MEHGPLEHAGLSIASRNFHPPLHKAFWKRHVSHFLHWHKVFTNNGRNEMTDNEAEAQPQSTQHEKKTTQRHLSPLVILGGEGRLRQTTFHRIAICITTHNAANNVSRLLNHSYIMGQQVSLSWVTVHIKLLHSCQQVQLLFHSLDIQQEVIISTLGFIHDFRRLYLCSCRGS